MRRNESIVLVQYSTISTLWMWDLLFVITEGKTHFILKQVCSSGKKACMFDV